MKEEAGMFRTLTLSIAFLVSLSAFADELALPELRANSNPDALLFYESALELTRQMTEDEARFRDAITREVVLAQDLARNKELRQKNAVSQEELEKIQSEHAVAVEETKVAKGYFDMRKHEVIVTLLQEKHHAGEHVDFGELKAGYLKRWKMRHDIAKLTKLKSEAEMLMHDARLARNRKLHGERATSTQEYQAIKADRYIALHAKKAAEKQLEFYGKVFQVFR
jgi:hypothetical protein